MRFTNDAPSAHSARRRRPTRLFVGIGIASACALGLGGASYALWNAEVKASGGVITAGDLDLSYGEGTWSQITPGVTDPSGGTLAEGSEGFHSMPGDIMEIRVPLTTTLQGDNLNARMNVEMGAAAANDIRDGIISATYVVEDSAGEISSAHAHPGTPVDVAGLVATNEGETASWTVVMTVEVLGEYRWTATAPLQDLDSWAIGGLNVTLEQIRAGAGFENGEG